jgi:hypothetical protein
VPRSTVVAARTSEQLPRIPKFEDEDDDEYEND